MAIKTGDLTNPQLFQTNAGFMGAPWATSADGAKAAILGVPFDCGTHAFRIGSREGRARSANSRAWCAPMSRSLRTMMFAPPSTSSIAAMWC